jgi:hypothetical protein
LKLKKFVRELLFEWNKKANFFEGITFFFQKDVQRNVTQMINLSRLNQPLQAMLIYNYLNFNRWGSLNSTISVWETFCNSQSCLWCICCWIALMQTWNQILIALEGG